MINLLPRLEIVSTFSVGYDKINLNKCKENGIKVTNTRHLMLLPRMLPDLAIALALSTLRKICVADAFVRKGSWNMGNFPFTISTKFSGKSVGIVGLGRIGSAIAKRAQVFNCPVSYYLRSRKLDNNYKYYTNIIDLAANCQILFVSALLEGRLGGAGIDVFENEPNVPDQLLGLHNVVLLPHVGTSTMETSAEMANLVIKNLEAHFKNEPLLTPVL